MTSSAGKVEQVQPCGHDWLSTGGLKRDGGHRWGSCGSYTNLPVSIPAPLSLHGFRMHGFCPHGVVNTDTVWVTLSASVARQREQLTAPGTSGSWVYRSLVNTRYTPLSAAATSPLTPSVSSHPANLLSLLKMNPPDI